MIANTLGALCDPKNGIQTGPFGSQLHKEDYAVVGTPIITVEHLGENRITRQNLPLVSDRDVERLYRYRLEEGDIVFSRVGSVDRRALVRREEKGWLFSGRCLRVRPNTALVDSEFLSYYLGLPSFKDYIRGVAVGATMPSINTKILSEAPVRLPGDVTAQRRIGRLLGRLDDKIELNRRMNETLEAMAQAIFRDWFVDFGPVRRKLAGEIDPVTIMGGLAPDPARAAELAALFPARLDEDGLPEGWTDCPIGDQVEIAGGSTPSTADDSLWFPAEHRWATPKDLSNMSDLALFETGRRISSAGLAKITSGLLPAGTVLLSSRAPIGYLAIAQEPVAINQGFIALKPTADHGSAYLYLWCKANMEAILANANGSTFQEISKKNFRPITSATPDEPGILRTFGEIAQPLIDRIVSAARENRALAEARDYLLPRLMSGQVQVGDAAVVEAHP